MKFVTCNKCEYYETDGDEVFQCDCKKPKPEKNWIDKIIDEIEKEKERKNEG